MDYTSIQISPKTRKELAKLKGYKRETYDEVINALMTLVPTGDDEGEYTDEFRAGLLRARMQIATGQTVKHEVLMKKLGL